MNVQQLESELWEAADQLRANSKLTAAEYSRPELGLIFLRHANNRFNAYLPEIEAAIPPQVPAVQREDLIRLDFQGKAAIYLPEAARLGDGFNIQGNLEEDIPCHADSLAAQ